MSKQPNAIDADALLRSLEPVVAKPDPAPSGGATRPATMRPAQREAMLTADESAYAATPASREPAAAEPARRPMRRVGGGASRAKMDVAINPGEGSTALYVRVPRTTHVALKLLALQNQAALEGPQDLATIVRTAIDEFLERNHSPVRATG